MKMFAVILASIAAISASVQAYLIWRDGGSQTSQIELERIRACKSLIQHLSELRRVTENPEESIRNALAQGDDNRRRYPSEFLEEMEFTDEMRQEEAKRTILFSALSPARGLQIVTDVDSLFFTDVERSEIGFSIFSEGVYSLDRYIGYYPPSASGFDERIARLQNAAAQLPAAKRVCGPILADK